MSSLMVNAGCVNQDRSRLLAVKLIQSALLTANRDEINGAETSSKMRRVIELFTHCTWHFRDDIKVPGRSRSIAPTRFLYAASSSCWREIPRNSKRRINVSSIKLFGQDAPAVMPMTAGPFGSQKCETTSRFSCKL